ncbi:MAG: ribosome biogenesis GTPase Der [Myxococcales bacterium]|jgi:GTP-binding protein|nr:ribosome biogenesis GTPase Der [Myxococcales bacterium]
MSRRRRSKPMPKRQYPGKATDYPVVAILGRPNVGKSALFNRLAGRQLSIVEDQPGITRDRIYADADVFGRPVTYVDMGGWEIHPEGPIEIGINQQCQAAIAEATLILFVVDGRVPPTSGDVETADLLRRSGVPLILVINKLDSPHQDAEAADIFSLGIDNWVMVSALHGRGFTDLEDKIHPWLPKGLPAPTAPAPDEAPLNPLDDPHGLRVAVIGRPNAGKSSLINHLLGEDRLLTLDIPGTTRDAIDTLVTRNDRQFIFVDTAGIRRKSRVPTRSPERMAVSSAVRAVENAKVVVLLLDADQGVAEQDARILGLATDRGKALVIALNKWDLLKGDAARQREVHRRLRDIISYVPWAKVVNVSALKGTGINQLLTEIERAFATHCQRVSTSRVNELFADIVAHHPPPLRKGRPVKLYFATQVSICPPTFVVQCSYPEAIHFSYERYVQNRLRETFGFEGTPVRVFFRQRARKGNKGESPTGG